MSTVEDFRVTTPPGGHMCHRQQVIDFIGTLGFGDARDCRCLHGQACKHILGEREKFTFWPFGNVTRKWIHGRKGTSITSTRLWPHRLGTLMKLGSTYICRRARAAQGSLVRLSAAPLLNVDLFPPDLWCCRSSVATSHLTAKWIAGTHFYIDVRLM